jgi:hypothetical protein
MKRESGDEPASTQAGFPHQCDRCSDVERRAAGRDVVRCSEDRPGPPRREPSNDVGLGGRAAAKGSRVRTECRQPRQFVGDAVTVSRSGVGLYSIRFNGLTAQSEPQGGVVQVSALGTTPRQCRILQWSATGSIDLAITVACFRPNSDPIDTPFSVSFLATSVASGRLGYMRTLFQADPFAEPEFYYSFNSAAGPMSVTRSAPGAYTALFEDLDTDGGTVLVTSFENNRACRVKDWADVTAGVQVRVRCYTHFGQLHDAQFTLSFMDGLGLKGFGGASVAYLLANQPATPTYTPPAASRFSTEGGTPSVKWLSKGRYEVRLPNFETGGAAFVTAMGDGKQRCQLDSLPTAGSPKVVRVRCFTAAGAAANSPFALSFEQ